MLFEKCINNISLYFVQPKIYKPCFKTVDGKQSFVKQVCISCWTSALTETVQYEISIITAIRGYETAIIFGATVSI